jgi:hypothetical protein
MLRPRVFAFNKPVAAARMLRPSKMCFDLFAGAKLAGPLMAIRVSST